jgi:hypothetical protein
MKTARAKPKAGGGGNQRFYLGMALAIAGTVVFGFTLNASRYHFDVAGLPPLVHVHALFSMLWIVLFVVQSGLVVVGSTRLHRKLGWGGAVIATMVVATGVAVTIGCIRRGAVPPFFPPNLFLVVDTLGVTSFFGLTACAIALRRHAEWHRRFMLCGTVLLMSPALARIIPMPLLGTWAGCAVSVAMLVYIGVAMVRDRITIGRVHPAYWWGAGTVILTQLLAGPIAFSRPVVAFTASLSGHP